MDHVERSKHRGLGPLNGLGGCFQPKNQVPVPRVITGKLSFKKLPPLKLPAAFPEGKASTMSWDNQVAAKEGNNMVSGAENLPKSA